MKSKSNNEEWIFLVKCHQEIENERGDNQKRFNVERLLAA